MTKAVWGWIDLLLIVCLAVPCLILGAGIGRIVPVIRPLRELIAQFVFYAAWIALIRLLIRYKYGRTLRGALAWTTNWSLWVCVPSGVVLALTTAGLGYLLRAPQVDPPFKELWDRLDTFALFVVAGVILGPIVEELFFRGFLLPLLAKAGGEIPAIFLAAVPFALMHGVQYKWAWQYLILVGLSGVVFGWARVRLDSTAGAALLHGSYNFTFLLAQVLYKIS